MSALSPPLLDQHSVLLRSVWVDCLRAVLSELVSFSLTVETEITGDASATEPATDKTELWALLTVSKAVAGEMAIVTTEAGAVQLAQLLTSEPPDPAVPFDATRREAFDELIRITVGQIATSLKGAAGGEVEIKLTGSEAPGWQNVPRMGMRVGGEKIPAPIRLGLFVTPELAESFRSSQVESAASEAAALVESSAPTPPLPSESYNSNLELLLDVTLEATICFGQKEMLLRDILELHPGAAVVLDRHVEEPVDLLVGGRMVARGEVVVVDGNYGLRITEIVSPQQRIAFLTK